MQRHKSAAAFWCVSTLQVIIIPSSDTTKEKTSQSVVPRILCGSSGASSLGGVQGTEGLRHHLIRESTAPSGFSKGPAGKFQGRTFHPCGPEHWGEDGSGDPASSAPCTCPSPQWRSLPRRPTAQCRLDRLPSCPNATHCRRFSSMLPQQARARQTFWHRSSPWLLTTKHNPASTWVDSEKAAEKKPVLSIYPTSTHHWIILNIAVTACTSAGFRGKMVVKLWVLQGKGFEKHWKTGCSFIPAQPNWLRGSLGCSLPLTIRPPNADSRVSAHPSASASWSIRVAWLQAEPRNTPTKEHKHVKESKWCLHSFNSQ